jgi:hypothetical protein
MGCNRPLAVPRRPSKHPSGLRSSKHRAPKQGHLQGQARIDAPSRFILATLAKRLSQLISENPLFQSAWQMFVRIAGLLHAKCSIQMHRQGRSSALHLLVEYVILAVAAV